MDFDMSFNFDLDINVTREPITKFKLKYALP